MNSVGNPTHAMSLGQGEGGSSAETQSHRVRKRVLGRRLDKYLHGRYPRISRTVLQRMIKQGLVTVNGLPTKASLEPAAGDLVSLELPAPLPTTVTPEDLPLVIIHEDRWLLAINKQPGMICHPARATQTGTVANAVAFHAKQLSHGEDPFRPGIVHRLDKNTSGVMLVAKSDEAHWRLALQFERRTIRKHYFAICEGEIGLDADIINKPLAPHQQTTERMVLQAASPPRQAMFKEAITEYRVRKRYRSYTSVDLFPKTGRTHQLRVHMASIGHPMVGDRMYGGQWATEFEVTGSGSTEPLLEFQALHARKIEFMHPILEKPFSIEAPIPDHLLAIVELLEQSRQR